MHNHVSVSVPVSLLSAVANYLSSQEEDFILFSLLVAALSVLK